MSSTAVAGPVARRHGLAGYVPWSRRQAGAYGWVLVFLAPFLVLFLALTLYPIVATVGYSFFEFTGVTPSTFVGFKQYHELFGDKVFWQSFANTLFFVVANCLIKLPLSFLLGYVLTRPWLRLKALFRTVFFLPVIVNVALVGLVFTGFLAPLGPLGGLLTRLHIGSRNGVLNDPATATWVVIAVSVWQIFGQYLIYWMAALQNVPEDLYEAADVDGAGFWRRVRHVTLPSIRPIAITISLLGFADALRVFGLVFTMTPGPGGPDNSTNVLSTYIYQNAFGAVVNYGYAAAIASMFLMVAVALSVVYAFANRGRGATGLVMTGKAP